MADESRSYLALVMRSRRLLGWFVVVVTVGIAGFAASWAGLDVSLARVTTAASSAVRSDDGDFRTGCGVDEVIIVGDNAWRLNRTTGRIEPTDPGDAVCEAD